MQETYDKQGGDLTCSDSQGSDKDRGKSLSSQKDLKKMMRNNVFSRKRMINRNQQRTGAVSEVDKSSNGRLMSSSKKVGGDNDSMKSYCFALMT